MKLPMESHDLPQNKDAPRIRTKLASRCSQCDLSTMTVREHSCNCGRCPKCSQKRFRSIPCVGCQDWFPPVLAKNIEIDYDLYELWLAGTPKEPIEKPVEKPIEELDEDYEAYMSCSIN